MHTQLSLMEDLCRIGIDRKGTLLVHSSMKSIGPVVGGVDTVLNALSAYMAEGLLVLPTHTWDKINAENPKYFVQDTPSCVGILTEFFRKCPGVVRSLHPTHSVAALGKDAVEFTAGDEGMDTPCARGSVWGKLLDRKAAVLFIGVDLTRYTFIHGVEEWADIPSRITEGHELLFTVLPDGTEIQVPSRRHVGVPSDHFWKVEDLFLHNGVMRMDRFGDAVTRLCSADKTADLLSRMLAVCPELFSSNEPLSDALFQQFAETRS